MKERRFILRAYDGLSLTLTALVLTAGFPGAAHAYVDPSVMTYTIQALAGVAVALSAVLGVALRRTRRVLLRVLRIDENAHKQMEPKVVRISPDEQGAATALADADASAAAAKQELAADASLKPLPWPRRFLQSLVASVFLVGTVFVVAPLEVVAGSVSSLIFSLSDVAPLVIGAGAVAAVVLALVLSVLRGKVFHIAVTIAVALGICCYIQAMLLNRGLPIADGSPLDLMNYKTITVVGTVVWLGVLTTALIANKKWPAFWRPASMVACIALVLVQGVGVGSLLVSQPNEPERLIVTKEGLFEVGSEENAIVFVLDTFDTQQLNHLLQEDPDLLDEFTGFTYFEDSVGSMIPTRYGIPYLLTGRMPEGDEDFCEFIDTWYTDSTLLPDIKQAGYSIGMYSDSARASYLRLLDTDALDFIAEQADNIHSKASPSLDLVGTLGILDKVALYRDAPWLLKPLFWFYTDDVNNGAVSKSAADSVPYTIDDVSYSDELFDRGLTIGADGKAFRFIHLNGAHPPYVLASDGHEAKGGSDLDQASRGALAVVEEYLRELKELGLYDSASIIITADHGEWYLTPDELSGPTSPILLVKPAESAEEAAAPLKVSLAPTGHLDYAATLIAAVGGDSAAYGPTVFEVGDGPRIRRYWMTTSDGHADQYLKEMVIDGLVLDGGNWRFTGKEILVDKAVLEALADKKARA